jgi:hypothetical protein
MFHESKSKMNLFDPARPTYNSNPLLLSPEGQSTQFAPVPFVTVVPVADGAYRLYIQVLSPGGGYRQLTVETFFLDAFFQDWATNPELVLETRFKYKLELPKPAPIKQPATPQFSLEDLGL